MKSKFQSKLAHLSKLWIIALSTSFFMQLISCVTPGWMISTSTYESDHFTNLKMSLWYIIQCNSTQCVTLSMSQTLAVLEGRSDFVIAFGVGTVMMPIAILASIVAFVMALLFRSHLLQKGLDRYSQITFVATSVASVVSGSLDMSLAALYGDYVRRQERLINFDTKLADFSFPYSLCILGMSGLIAPLAFVCLLWLVCTFSSEVEKINQTKIPEVEMR